MGNNIVADWNCWVSALLILYSWVQPFQGPLESTAPQSLLKLSWPTPRSLQYQTYAQKHTALKRIWRQTWMVSLQGSSDPPIKRMSQTSPRPDKCRSGFHLIASCVNFLSLVFKFYFLFTSCHVFPACKRQDAICIHKLQGDFYSTVEVTLPDIILTVWALDWYMKLIIRCFLILGLHLGNASP